MQSCREPLNTSDQCFGTRRPDAATVAPNVSATVGAGASAAVASRRTDPRARAMALRSGSRGPGVDFETLGALTASWQVSRRGPPARRRLLHRPDEGNPSSCGAGGTALFAAKSAKTARESLHLPKRRPGIRGRSGSSAEGRVPSRLPRAMDRSRLLEPTGMPARLLTAALVAPDGRPRRKSRVVPSFRQPSPFAASCSSATCPLPLLRR